MSPSNFNSHAFITPVPLNISNHTKNNNCQHVLKGKRNIKACIPSSHSKTANIPSHLYSIDTCKLSTDKSELLRSFIKTRASLNPDDETIYTFTGLVHACIDGDKTQQSPLFRIHGLSVARCIPTDKNGYRLLTREVAFYTSVSTDESSEPLTDWDNPFTGTKQNVIHVWNDPVNQDLIPDKSLPLNITNLDNGQLCYNVDVFPKYSNPIPTLGNELYESSELFSFFINNDNNTLNDRAYVKDVTMSWSRIGPWLPWMGMNGQKGRLVYHCRGCRVSKIPDYMKDWIFEYGDRNDNDLQRFLHAPWEYSRPNETSWSYMKKLIQRKGYPRADGRVAPRESPLPGPSPPLSFAGTNSGMVRLSGEQLRAFKGGLDESIPVYVSVTGRIFDVSSSRRNYGLGETYHCLTGVDSSIQMLSGHLMSLDVSSNNAKDNEDEHKVIEVIDLMNLTDEQKHTLNKWVQFFSSRYEQVGVLVDYYGYRAVVDGDDE